MESTYIEWRIHCVAGDVMMVHRQERGKRIPLSVHQYWLSSKERKLEDLTKVEL